MTRRTISQSVGQPSTYLGDEGALLLNLSYLPIVAPCLSTAVLLMPKKDIPCSF
jgi:hypothetical protein